MNNLQELKVTEVHHFKQDDLPFSYLNTKVFIDSLKDAFGFQSQTPLVVQNGIGPGYDFFSGGLKTQSHLIPIQQFRFEPTRLSLVVVGDSTNAKSVFDGIVNIIREIGQTFISKALVTGEQTSCIVTLDLNFRSLFDPRLVRFLEDKTKEIAHKKDNDDAIVEPRGFRASIRVPDKHHKGNNVGAETIITIEPRIGTDLSEQRFFISAPVDSTTLIHLIEEFEVLFKVKQ